MVEMQAILTGLQYGTMKSGGDGRRLLFPEGREGWHERKSSPEFVRKLNEFRSIGDRLLKEPIETIPFRLYKLYDTTGDREQFQKVYFERRRRLDVFAVLSLADGDPRYVEALEDTIWAICGEYTWCLPAHLGGNSLRVTEKANHRETIDLFNAETALYLCEIVHLLEDVLPELVVYRAREEARSRVLDPYLSASTAYWWETTDMNWAAVCAGSVGAAAMYLIQDDDALYPILRRVADTLDCFVGGFTDDGACLEGILYWNYGFGFYAGFAELLRQRTGGRIDLMKREKIKNIALFQQKCYLYGNAVLSYSDSSQTYDYHPGLTHYLKSRYEELEIPERQYEAGILGDNCFRWLFVIRNLVWNNLSDAGSGLRDADYYLQDAQILVSRRTIGTRKTAFSAKGGHNGEPHNHNDVGSFIYLVDGEQLLADPGSGVYSKQYFGDARYSLIYTGSHGHSVPIVEGAYQLAGMQHRATIHSAIITDAADEYVMDIAGAYSCPKLLSLIRHFRFDKRSGALRLEDRYSFSECPSGLTERFVTFFDPVVMRDGTVRIKGSRGTGIQLTYDPEQLVLSVIREPFIHGNEGKEWLYCIDLQLRVPKTDAAIVVEVSLDDG
ncbi:heparinase II/III family protein [Paenibacillus alkalitolerans]|uniref:heparinase II/III family protein n=1 Tax=Paenibacillus alkalitolerans TaxID=2799335 RepID=UPI0018F37BBF